MVQFRELTVCLFSLQWGFISQRCTEPQVSWRPPCRGRTQPSRTTLWGFDQRYFCLGFWGEVRRSGQGWEQIRWEGKIPQREKHLSYLCCCFVKVVSTFLVKVWLRKQLSEMVFFFAPTRKWVGSPGTFKDGVPGFLPKSDVQWPLTVLLASLLLYFPLPADTDLAETLWELTMADPSS